MIQIDSPVQGQVLNRLQGRPTDDGLLVEVRGRRRGSAAVTVNGQAATLRLDEFQATALLRPGRNTLVAEASGGYGAGRHEVVVYYDAATHKRYRLSVDDNSFWLREIGRNADRYRSLFDCFYLKLWHDLHRDFGLKVVLNIYFSTADGFTLPDFSDRWKGEFADHADWLKLAWHARSNDPDRLYEYAAAETIAHDYDQVAEQIVRFAGEATLSLPTVVHWAEVTRAGMQPLIDRGVRNLTGIFHLMNGRRVGNYHLRDERADLADQCGQWIDEETGIAFSQIDLVGNSTPLDEVAPRLEARVQDPAHAMILDLFTHEQYFWDFYPRYIPDHGERLRAMVQWATEHDFQPCWFHEGFLGGPEVR